MDKKLPRFFGEPKKWQMFESAFVNATESCGLNNSENLSRLMDCLKRDALEAVQCRLLHPNSVPGVMNTLRLMYGRPDLIIHKLLEEIKMTSPPKTDDLGSLVKFAISVQNLCATVQSYNALEHLRNPTLIKALTDKLPAQIQLNWAYYKHSIGDVNLSTLGNWLFHLATIASDVVVYSTDKIINKGEPKFRSLLNSNSVNCVNAQSEGDMDDSDNSSIHSTNQCESPRSHSESEQSRSGSRTSESSRSNSTECSENTSYLSDRSSESEADVLNEDDDGWEDLDDQINDENDDQEEVNQIPSEPVNGGKNVGSTDHLPDLSLKWLSELTFDITDNRVASSDPALTYPHKGFQYN